jgi:hypothetical protein
VKTINSIVMRLAVGIAVVAVPGAAQAQLADFWGTGFQNLVSNGGFETNTLPTGTNWATLGTTSSTLSVWQIKSGNVQLYRKGFFASPNLQPGGTTLASQGLQAFLLEINGSTTGTIGQNVDVVAGKKYILQFWMSANAGAPGAALVQPPIKTMDVLLGGSTISAQSYDVTGLNNKTAPWLKKTVQFQSATTGNVALDFASTNAGANGMFIDNVTLVMVPEPATGLLALAGIAPLAWVVRRRRMASA